MVARVEQLKGVPKAMDKPDAMKPTGSLDYYRAGEFPLTDCKVGETITLKVKVEVTAVRQDKHGGGLSFEIKSVEKYK